MGVQSFKSFVAANGLPGWRVYAGSNVLGTIFNPGPSLINPNSWYGVAPDGSRVEDRSKQKVADKLLKHSAAAKPQ